MTVTRERRDALTRMVRGALARDDEEAPPLPSRVKLRLYICGGGAKHSIRALELLAAILGEYNPDHVTLDVVDVRDDPDEAERDGVVVTPTLVKKYPVPRTWIAGVDEAGPLVRRLLDDAGVERSQ